jgi:hypothetical protein
MKIKTLAIMVAWCSLMTASAFAGLIPGRWDKVDQLPAGTAIVVHLFSGEKLEANFIRTSPDSLDFTLAGGPERHIPKSEVREVSRAEKTRDSLKNGLLIGTGAGFAIGFCGLAAFNAHETASGPIWDTEAVSTYAGAGVLGGLIGALVGIGIDSAVKTQEQLFRAP